MLTEKRFGFKKLCVMFLAFAILAQVFLPNSLLNPLTVSAASGDNWDLSNFVTNVTLDGNPISGTYSVGESYVFKISFAERAGANGQFAYKNGVLTYQLPEGLKTTPVTGGSIRSSSGATIGTYDIDSSGLVKVKFNDCKVNGTPTAGVNFIDNYTDASFSLEIKAQFDKVPSGGKVIFDLNSSVTLNLAGPQPALTVEKKAGSVTSAKTISYTVTVKASGAPVTNITLKDIPFARIGTNSAGTQYKITDAALFAAYSNIKFSKNSESPTAIADFASLTGSGYTFTGVTLNPGDTLTLTYTLDVQKLVTLANSKGVKLLNSSSYAVSNPLHYDLYVGNDLEVTSPSTDPKVYKASVQSRVTRAFISKIHTGTPSASNPNINWEATVGDGTMPLNGDAIIDTLGAYMAFPADTAIKVTFYNASSAKIGSKDFTMAELTALNASYVTISGSKLTINVPPATAEYSSGNKFGDVYKVVLKYTTPATLPSA
ncbi:MAG: hypothetical protein FWG44_05565, partial [Oscillospiraceae bacterium]|nr:hypothetical protein [Oscillospiraceae bacterium]